MKLGTDQQGGSVSNLGKKCLQHGKSEGAGKEMDLKSRREQLMDFCRGITPYQTTTHYSGLNLA